MTSEQMRAELEREGYSFHDHEEMGGGCYTDAYIETPDGFLLVWNHDNECIHDAYAHLQAQRKLVALEAFVLEVAADITSPDIGDIREDYNSAIVKVFALIEQFNITADESDNDE